VEFVEVDASKILELDQEEIAPREKLSIYSQPQLPAQQPQEQPWLPARMTEGLQALSDAALADEERTPHPQDWTLWDWEEDDPDDEDFIPDEQDLLPLAQHQREHLQQQQQDYGDMRRTPEYTDESLDFFLKGAAAHTADNIDPDLERLTAGAVKQMEVKFDGLSEEDMAWLRSQQPMEEVTALQERKDV